ncbi:hypothetical protein PHYSODRAFT_297193 [Phytophthora sojae]|uniref:Uncharacterized protein n=1 Tax=Phytophthora sojae (strain P6497) TaxID=1094619 RepID=G4YWE1_PHYSP|nr:hypothetical protein PHYSODRAFT_297193 [Phytophthora sojae]EGZ25587.1 hypothetical protein PHYSODRAFT_297193 [Phytophthora sojae]|eukprot:XP_009520875.1 hypothetical protein PHYSODRAFT_297193 [Phytophthora sojae]
MLQWLYETQPREAAATPKYAIAMLASVAACYRPCPRVVKWLFENGEPTSGIVEGTAVGRYNLELIQWLVKRRPSFNTPKAVRIAAQNRNVACMRWLLEQFGKLDEDLVVDLVGEFGYREVLALQAERVRVASLASAVRNGKFDVVKQLFKGDHERFADTQRVIREAVQNDQENIVQWLRQEVNLEDRYTWDFGPTIGRTRNRDDDTPEGRQIMSAILRKHPHFM